jgi:hypothetical protein
MQLVSPNYRQDSILTHSIHPAGLRTRKLECNAQLRRNGLTRLISYKVLCEVSGGEWGVGRRLRGEHLAKNQLD